MPERDANQLAADVPRLTEIAEAADNGNPWEWQGGYPQRVLRIGDVVVVADCFEDPDSPARFAEFIATFDPPTVRELVALVGTLQQEHDECKALGLVGWRERAVAAEAALAEAEKRAADAHETMLRVWQKREDAEAALAENKDSAMKMHDWGSEWKVRAYAAEAALATTRQALEDIAYTTPANNAQGTLNIFRERAALALLALERADTGGDTA